jgi:hypothetical protein
MVRAIALGAVALAWRRTVTPWHRRWGATDQEAGGRLPGDELVAEPADQVTRAISIDAPPEAVWPWIVQLGADRAGFYSYEWLENLFGLGIRNSDVIVPEWQEREAGDLVLADAKGSGGWIVTRIDPGAAMVLQVADVAERRPVRRDERPGWEFLWSFVVRPLDDGRTRLLVRERTGFANPLIRLAMAPVGFVSFVMSRRMLRTIKANAEARR